MLQLRQQTWAGCLSSRLYQAGTSRSILRPRRGGEPRAAGRNSHRSDSNRGVHSPISMLQEIAAAPDACQKAPGEASLEQEFASSAILARSASKISSGSNRSRRASAVRDARLRSTLLMLFVKQEWSCALPGTKRTRPLWSGRFELSSTPQAGAHRLLEFEISTNSFLCVRPRSSERSAPVVRC
jgi:hypothetical protein